MDKQELTQLLQQVADGDVTPDDAALRLKMQPFQEIGAYAKVDFHRGIRQGVPEVIFGEGKAKEHILGIAREMLRSGQRTILITRLSAEAAAYLETDLPLHYDSAARVGIIGELPPPGGKGRIVVATGGTSDIPVAEVIGEISSYLPVLQYARWHMSFWRECEKSLNLRFFIR